MLSSATRKVLVRTLPDVSILDTLRCKAVAPLARADHINLSQLNVIEDIEPVRIGHCGAHTTAVRRSHRDCSSLDSSAQLIHGTTTNARHGRSIDTETLV